MGNLELDSDEMLSCRSAFQKFVLLNQQLWAMGSKFWLSVDVLMLDKSNVQVYLQRRRPFHFNFS